MPNVLGAADSAADLERVLDGWLAYRARTP